MAPFALICLLSFGGGGSVVVRTTDGSVLRGTVEAVEGGIRIRSGETERFVPEADILWTADGTELLRQAREMVEGAGTGRPGATRHAQAALWCAEMGLDDEADRLLDRAVALDAGAPAVTRAIKQFASTLAGEAERTVHPAEWILRNAPSTGGRRLVAEEAIGLLGREETVPALVRALASPRTPTRRVASSVLGERFPGEGTQRLAAVAIADTDEGVRENAVVALRGAGGEKAARALAPHLFSGPTSVHRKRATAALERLGSPAAVPPLAEALRRLQVQAAGGPRGYVFFGNQVSYVRDFDVEVAQNAAIGDPQIGVITDGVVLDARVLSTRTERIAIVGALTKIVGSNLGEDPGAWESWYRAQKR